MSEASDLYGADILLWSKRQADLLRRRALPEAFDGQPPLPVPDICPVTFDELLSDAP